MTSRTYLTGIMVILTCGRKGRGRNALQVTQKRMRRALPEMGGVNSVGKQPSMGLIGRAADRSKGGRGPE